jgi:methylated-DNA-[protein]-cysteine S-methyltransferase
MKIKNMESAMNDQTFYFETIATPIRQMIIVTDRENRLRAVDWEDCRPRMDRLLKRHCGPRLDLRQAPGATAARRSLQAYFAGKLEAINDLPLMTNGTEFQRAVWDALRRIPAGQTASYGTLAAEIGCPKAVRAVGLANGANPLPIFVPCHRVIGSNGSLTGFGGGLNRKRWLLAHEHSHCQAKH